AIAPVRGPVEGAVVPVADPPALAAAGHHQVERAVRGPRDPPGEGLRPFDPRALRGPVPAAVVGAVDPAAERAGPEAARAPRARRVEKDVRDRALRHSRRGRPPGPP